MNVRTTLRDVAVAVTFLIYGGLAGWYGAQLGSSDVVQMFNFPGAAVMDIMHNRILILHWQRTLQPVRYETSAIMDGKTSQQVGREVVPIYDFPFTRSALIGQVSTIVWGTMGVVVQLCYSILRRTNLADF